MVGNRCCKPILASTLNRQPKIKFFFFFFFFFFFYDNFMHFAKVHEIAKANVNHEPNNVS